MFLLTYMLNNKPFLLSVMPKKLILGMLSADDSFVSVT